MLREAVHYAKLGILTQRRCDHVAHVVLVWRNGKQFVEAIASIPPAEAKQILGEKLFDLVQLYKRKGAS